MRASLWATAFAALFLEFGSTASGIDIPLTFQTGPLSTHEGEDLPVGSGYVQTRSSLPPGNWKLPVFSSNDPRYAVIQLGDHTHLLVLDTAKPGDTVFSRVWLDRDADGDLTGETPANGTIRTFPAQSGQSYSVSFPPLDIPVRVGGDMLPYRIRSWAYPSGQVVDGDRTVSVSYTVDCRYSGTFSRNGKRHTVTLIDADGNGRFDEHAAVTALARSPKRVQFFARSDYLCIGGTGPEDPGAAHPLGDLLLLDDGVFLVKIDIPKGRMTLTEVTEGLGTLHLPFPTERLTLMTADRKRFVMVDRSAGTSLRLPAGNYQLVSYRATRKDEQGDFWRIGAAGSTASPVVTVTAGTASTLPLGEPFTTGIDVSEAYSNKETTTLEFFMEGRGKELIDAVSHYKGTATAILLSKSRPDWPKEPSYTIVKSDGEIVLRGSFEYG